MEVARTFPDSQPSFSSAETFCAEATLQGKPVIVTDRSAPCEFCNEENASGVTRWAERDVDAAAKALRRLYDDPALRRQLGENGRKTIAEHFSIENFKKSIDAFL